MKLVTAKKFIVPALLLMAATVRLVGFGTLPPGLNQDEASLGYDAYSILHFGIDRHEVPYPAFLIAWGSGMNALAAYLSMPFIAIFGLSPFSLRFVNLVAGLVSIPAFYCLLTSVSNKRVATWGTLVLSVSPWHIMMSRWALESNLLPCVFLLGLLCLVRSRTRPFLLPVASIFFGLCLYAYGTAYFVVPVFLLMATAYSCWTKTMRWRWFSLALLVFTLIATPIAATIIVNRFHLPATQLFGLGIPRMTTVARFERMSSVFGQAGLERSWQNIVSLWNLFITQDDGAPWNSIAGYGIFYPTALGLGLVGAVVFVRDLARSRLRTGEAWLAMWLAPALLLGVLQDPNINRLNLLWMPLAFVIARGIEHIATDGRFTLSLAAAHLGMFVLFCAVYFGNYKRNVSDAFFPNFGAAVQAATSRVHGPICVTNRVNMPYALVLFYDLTDPRLFARTVVYEGDGEFQGVRSFGRFTFGLDRCDPSTAAYVLERGEDEALEAAGVTLFRSSRYLVVQRP